MEGDGSEQLYFIDSHAHLDMVLDRLTDNQSRKTQKDFIDFFAANWTEEVVRDLYTAQKGFQHPPMIIPHIPIYICVYRFNIQ